MNQRLDHEHMAEPVTWQAMEQALDILCPMHLRVTDTGHILHAGPTLQKLRPDRTLVGARFLEIFQLDRPRAITSIGELMTRARGKLHLEFRDEPQTALKGVLVKLPEGQGALINLSFGISVVDGVQDYKLTSGDFAATDLAIEMLYLVEAKSAAMESSRKLNHKLQGAKVAAEEQAVTDTLTGLRNRRAADHVLEHLISERKEFALMHLDLDFFKAVNDTLGHAAGDHVLQHVAGVMSKATRKGDLIARVGGDEFMILFEGLTRKERLAAISRSLIKGIEAPILFEGEKCQISASIGIALYRGDSEATMDALVQQSDKALYASKGAGRGRATFFDEVPTGK